MFQDLIMMGLSLHQYHVRDLEREFEDDIAEYQ